MSYMIKTLNTKDEVEKLYKEIATHLAQNESKKIKTDTERQAAIDVAIANEKARIEHLSEIINHAKFIDISPYKTTTQSNNKTSQIGTLDPDDKVQIKSETFADCADITSRHIINLLTYSNTKNWDLFLKDVNIEDLDAKLKKVVDAINNKSQVDFYDLKTRLQIFFLYQRGVLKDIDKDEVYRSERKADDVTSLFRTLWEYVICNMDSVNLKNGPDKDKGYYEIQYSKNNIEVESGYINLLKLMWNVAKALNPSDTKLSNVKEQIDNLNSMLATYNPYTKLKEVLDLTFTLFHPENNVHIDIENCKYEKINTNDEITGEIKVTITKDDQVLNFAIIQQTGHAEVKHNPIQFNEADKFTNAEYINNDFAKLLLRSFTKGSSDYKKIPAPTGFYGDFSKETWDYWNYNALNILRGLQDEENNICRINNIHFEVMQHASKISVKQKLQSDMGEPKTIVKKLSDIFYERYLKPNEDKLDLDWDQSLYDYEKVKFGEIEVFTGPEHTDVQKITGFEVIKVNENGDEVRLLINDSEKNITIPLSIYDINGKKLKVSIGRTSHLYNLETVTFRGDCEDLKIMQHTFKESRNLHSVNFFCEIQNLTIGERAFLGSSLTNFNIFGNIINLKLYSQAFSSCQLESFTVRGNVTNLVIGYYAFAYSNLNEITLPTGVENLKIFQGAFENSKLENFIVPESVKMKSFTIDRNAFCNCHYLKNFIFKGNITDLVIAKAAFLGSNITNFTISGNVTNLIVGDCAFARSNLIDFTIAGNVLNFIIGDYAFKYSKLKNFVLPENIEGNFDRSQLGNFATIESGPDIIISGNTLISNQTADLLATKGIKNFVIGAHAFEECQITSFIVPQGIEKLTIGAYSFAESQIESFIVPESVTDLEINNYAFTDCQIESFIVPDNVKNLNVGDSAFEYSQLASFTVPENVTSLTIGTRAFAESEITNFTVLGHITDLLIAESTFEDSQLKNFIIPEDIKNLIINPSAFKCSQLESFTVPKSVINVTICAYAFAESEIESFIVLGSTTNLIIDESAFKKCSKKIDFIMPPRKRKRF